MLAIIDHLNPLLFRIKGDNWPAGPKREDDVGMCIVQLAYFELMFYSVNKHREISEH
ncbi:hypothetical protein KDA_70490 [Dictyobacter alpinus]|uniref:Uncharacterized protein n=1 Tax=Dictyobacter alpinus TaxID=2014873 RepID=A0A402BJQ0_9CHLR|nr:hypothetical protein KDA_70490 [Dictyobacter alpinus]